MRLESLMIHRRPEYHSTNPGKLTGTAKFENNNGSVEIVISEEAATRILALCATGIIEEAQIVAQSLTAAVLTQDALPQLPSLNINGNA